MWSIVGAIFLLFIISPVTPEGNNNSTANREKYAKYVEQYLRARERGELRKACSTRGAAPQPPSRVNTTARLIALREVMRDEIQLKEQPIDAYIITSYDEHMTEYTSDYDKRREYISGFSGTYGDVIVTMKKAALWTDGRYHLQADDQLNCKWLLMREGNQNVPTKANWLRSELKPGSRIGVDPKLIPYSEFNELSYQLQDTKLELVKLTTNLIDLIWVNHTAYQKEKDAFVLDIKYSGKPWLTKVKELRDELNQYKADAMVVTALDEIAWLLNVRGRDIPCNPFLRSYAIVSHTYVRLFVDPTKLLKNNVTKHLNAEYGITKSSLIVHDYEDIWTVLPTMTQAWRVVLLPTTCVFSAGASQAIVDLIPEEKRLLEQSPITYFKAKKNPTEIMGMQNAHLRDAAALCRFFAHLELRFSQGDELDEMKIVNIIDEFRFEQILSLGNSFNTVVGFGANGAQPHYEPSPSTNATIFDNNTIVIDSGGQYYDGTTDVTRTTHLGEPTEEHKRAYTRVLMGLIQFSSLVFPGHMKMSVADVLARQPLWEIGLDYMHGTGHGVGSFLGVHESPILVHYNNFGENDEIFEPGYFLSNEPGYYKENEFGVRLENVLEVVEKPWLKHSSGQSFYGFRDVTLVPFEPKLIDFQLLNENHKRWLNEYNKRIRILVGAELKRQNRTAGFYWMMDRTKYIPVNSSNLILLSIPLLCVQIIVVIYIRLAFT
ncbi:xaa-Pro aminopeptidase ApepP [Agrilus planipennis]|uniref:Xaa-Pro aminopeptidase ApepP n=1 Tax=Agrilus planipennis TaxID=224129 RepID=A0A7F5R908_AGRPL|nr:xaa-Pro aminopeptidase ApepP [Agrilus planipennis]